MIAGIDFSLNSPAICIKTIDKLKWISLYNLDRDPAKPTLKAFRLHEDLTATGAIATVRYARQVSAKEFLLSERKKMTDAESISSLIISHLTANSISQVALEGFSYGSKGNSFIDMVVYNSFLRQKLVKTYGISNFYVFQPSAVKKLAGKGNGNKSYMFTAFKNNVLQDPLLTESLLWQWCSDKEFGDKIPKPIDDCIDAYFIMKMLERSLNEK